jgi:hypothetical protein
MTIPAPQKVGQCLTSWVTVKFLLVWKNVSSIKINSLCFVTQNGSTQRKKRRIKWTHACMHTHTHTHERTFEGLEHAVQLAISSQAQAPNQQYHSTFSTKCSEIMDGRSNGWSRVGVGGRHATSTSHGSSHGDWWFTVISKACTSCYWCRRRPPLAAHVPRVEANEVDRDGEKHVWASPPQCRRQSPFLSVIYSDSVSLYLHLHTVLMHWNVTSFLEYLTVIDNKLWRIYFDRTVAYYLSAEIWISKLLMPVNGTRICIINYL